VLVAMSGGPRRRSRIAGRAQQRIDYTLDRLRRAGYVRTVRSLGSAGSSDPLYEIADDYLAFWFAVLRDDADLVEGGQGAAVKKRMVGNWQCHVGNVFERECRAHALRLVKSGALPDDTIVGRWWKDEKVEIDVLGLRGDSPVLIGECRWQDKAFSQRDLAELRRKAAWLPVTEDLRLAFWSRGGPQMAHPDVWSFGPQDLVGQGQGSRPGD
jgi:uncharacterized protein